MAQPSLYHYVKFLLSWNASDYPSLAIKDSYSKSWSVKYLEIHEQILKPLKCKISIYDNLDFISVNKKICGSHDRY